jgi:hypothetical protein
MRKKCNRRVWAKVNPIEHAKYQASLLTAKEWDEQMKPVIVALDRLSRGDWDKHECWGPMFECLNRIESVVKLYRIDGMPFVTKAQAAMVGALKRWEQIGAQSFKAEELATLREVVSGYGDLLKEVTHAQLQRVTAHTTANVRRILSNKGRMTSVDDCVFEIAARDAIAA